jgi:flagellar motor switch protein FliN/FliY
MAQSSAQLGTPNAIANELGTVDTSPRALALHHAIPPMEEHRAWPMIGRLPVMLAVNIPLRRFKVCHLLSLRPGQTIASTWPVTEDVPLKVGALQICCGEFEVLEQQMALRITSLA